MNIGGSEVGAALAVVKEVVVKKEKKVEGAIWKEKVKKGCEERFVLRGGAGQPAAGW